MKKVAIFLMFIVFVLNIVVVFHKLNHKGPLPPAEAPQQSPVAPQSETPPPEVPPEPPAPKKAVPEFIEIAVFRTSEPNSVYGDVLSHSEERPFGNSNGRAVNVHETSHGIHSYLRNKHGKNGFYCLEGRAVLVDGPRIKKSTVNDFVPPNLRSYRYNLYLVGQREWEDTPLYIYDEWTAYILGGKCCVDDVNRGVYVGSWTDGVSGCLEFSIYAIATAMAVKKYDPQYWESNSQFRNYTIWALREANETYKTGHVMKQFKWKEQDELLSEFLTSSTAEGMRNFVNENLDGVWLDTQVTEMEYEFYQSRTLTEDDIKEDNRP